MSKMLKQNIDDGTNEVILKTTKNENIYDHLHMLIYGNQKLNVIDSMETDKILGE